jgi:polysaccharide biosynthesis transport protein
MDLKDLLAVAWKRRVAVLAVFGLTMMFAALFAFSQAKRYESTATLALTPDIKQGQGLFAADNLSALLGTYAETAKSTITLRRAERALGRPLHADIDATTEAGTGILRISARSTDPQNAADAASAIATAFSDSIAENQVLDATLVDPPVAASSPVQPRPPLILLVAALIGGFAGVLLAFGLENFRRRIETPADIAEHTPAPVIARLPRQRQLARANAQIIWDQENVVGLQESYRALRTNLEFLLEDRSRVLEVTSPDPAQGKSTLVANLAVAFGQIGVETVIVDADLRRPRQHEIFGLDNTEGLSTIMALGGEPPLKPSGYPNLWVLTSGPVPPDPTEMLHIRFASVVESLRSMETLVLIDTPPVLPVSDARLIAPHADGVILVVTSGTQKPQGLESTLDKLELVDARLLGLVLNMAGSEPDASGGYYEYEVRDTGDDGPKPPRPRIEAG